MLFISLYNIKERNRVLLKESSNLSSHNYTENNLQTSPPNYPTEFPPKNYFQVSFQNV